MRNPAFDNYPKIYKWQHFIKYVRPKGCQLLYNLHEFPNAILVSGCQRSGTTILSRVITGSEGMVNFWFGKDDELDAAKILSGYIDYPKENGRYCFQTTYVNECYPEYFKQNTPFKIIWVLRNPYSVVYSMLHNWKRFALYDLFEGCGVELLDEKSLSRYKRFGHIALDTAYQACLAYNSKLSQLTTLSKKLDKDQLYIIDYDNLVLNKQTILNKIYNFIEIPYDEKYGEKIHTSSLKKQKKLSDKEAKYIENYCMPIYEHYQKYLT